MASIPELWAWLHFSTSQGDWSTSAEPKIIFLTPLFRFLWRCEIQEQTTSWVKHIIHTDTEKTEHNTDTQWTTCRSQCLWLECVLSAFFHTQREEQAERQIHFPEKAENFSFVLDTQQNQDTVCWRPSIGTHGVRCAEIQVWSKNPTKKTKRRPRK